MFVASYRNTESGIRRNMSAILAAKRQAEAEERADRQEAEDRHRLAEEHRRRAEEEAARMAAEEREAELQRLKIEVLGEATPKEFRHTYRMIEIRACQVFGVTRSELRSERRNRGVVFARQFVMYWAARLTSLSCPKIAQMLGRRDHSTIIHGRDVYPVKRAKMGRKLRRVR